MDMDSVITLHKKMSVQTVHMDTFEKSTSLLVNRQYIPLLSFNLSKQPCTQQGWMNYANWILAVWNIYTFSISYCTVKKLTFLISTPTNTKYFFCFASTWLNFMDEETYHNYKVNQAVSTRRSDGKVLPHEGIEDTHISSFDLQVDISCLNVQADCGMGKTQFGMKSLINKHVTQKHSILLPTENFSVSVSKRNISRIFSLPTRC